MRSILTPLSIVVSLAMIVTVFFITRSMESDTNSIGQEKAVSQNELATTVRIPSFSDVERDGVRMGASDAPVTITEYSDYACPFCARFWSETLPEIKSEYIDTGVVQYVYKDFAVVGGARAAEASHCAREQGAFWPYHYLLFSRHSFDTGRWNTLDVHLDYAEFLELDTVAFAECFNERRYREYVQSGSIEAQDFGARGTPFFMVNDIPLSGAQPFAAFEEVIESELNSN